MRLIPAIDILGGKCVRLSQGAYEQAKVYSDDPLEMAKSFEDHGLQFLHVVDLDGARSGRLQNAESVARIAAHTRLQIDLGGGIKTDEDLQRAFDCGARQVNVGSTAAAEPALFLRWLAQYGPERILLSADSKARRIAVSGWTQETALDVADFIRQYVSSGLKYAVCTDIVRDGMLSGPALELYRELLEIPGLSLIASGGIRSVEDLEALRGIGCEGAIIGKAIYEGHITLKDLAALC